MKIRWFYGLVLKGTGDPHKDIALARERLTHSETLRAINKVESEGSK